MRNSRTAAPPTATRNVVAYVRVSTEEQANEGVSLQAQEARIRAYCDMRNLNLVDVMIDAGVSAGKPLVTREGGRRVMDLVRTRRVHGVIALKLDRLFRDCADCLQVIRTWDGLGIALHLVDIGGSAVDTSSAMGRFFLTVMGGAAELERNVVGERTSLAMRHMASKSMYTGGHARYGFRVVDGGVLEPINDEQHVIALAVGLRSRGLSLRAVADELAGLGCLSRAGKPFVPCQVQAITSAA